MKSHQRATCLGILTFFTFLIGATGSYAAKYQGNPGYFKYVPRPNNGPYMTDPNRDRERMQGQAYQWRRNQNEAIYRAYRNKGIGRRP